MDSDDDMHDYYDAESIGDDHYIDDDDDVDGIDDPAVEKEDHDDSKDFIILSEADVRELQEEAITRLSNVLSISRVESCILLCHYKWDIGKVHDEWFADEGNIRKTVGLLEQPAVILKKQKLTCGICFETYPCGEMGATACGHKFCHGCWRGYIGTSISDGPGCLMLRCPEPSCPAAVGQDMINVFVSDEDKEKYSRFLLRSYVESKRKTKWCPAPGCTFAAEFHMSSSNYDVCCRCAHTFCWNCAEEAHRPVLCDTVAKWMLKNSAESENTNWILANSKPCPKCKRPIEKNLGCMHMTCTPPCRFQFCWLCLRAWSDHGRHNGGFYSCNYYQKAKEEGVYEEAERIREMAKTSLERYTHYYERWAANQSSRKKALADLRKMETEKLKKLRVKLSLTASELRFVTEAWEQIIECRRVLTWTYAYGYYLNEHETAKKRLFEYLQGEAEYGLERLHKCTESDLEVFFDAQNPLGNSEFIDFKAKLADLTRVTRNYFKNLVCALENGLQEIDQPIKEEDAGSSKQAAQSKGGKSKGSKRKKSETARETVITAADYENWECTYCTCINPNSTDRCEACEFGR